MPAKRLLLCDCLGTMAPDAAAISAGTGLECGKIARYLCRDDAARAVDALSSGEDVIVACGQMAMTFQELAEELDASARLETIDIRDRAGWSDEASGPKMAALLAEAQLAAPAVPLMEIASEGLCLVYGDAEVALPAGARLSEALSVTVMLTTPEETPPSTADIDIVTGKITNVSGALGKFSVAADRFAELAPAGRGARAFGALKNGAETECDIIVDLSGGQPLVPTHHKRDGYFRADPGDPLAVERALFDAGQMTGTFEKPLYIRFEESLCAHSRAGKPACSRCLDVCPTGAIMPSGDHISIDPDICAGCGACHAVCPSGASSYDDPPVAFLFRRMRTLAETYRKAGGGAPRLLVHDDHGAEMIRLAARYGRGLPGDVIPMEISALSGFGHAEQITALGLGFSAVDILAAPRTEREVITAQIALCDAITAGAGHAAGRIRLIDATDPDLLSDLLYGTAPEPLEINPILPLGGRRDATRLAAKALTKNEISEPITLPAGAPYGAVLVNTDSCTMCLACAGLCPTGALLDSPDSPELSFREEACIQCGLCANVCPEAAITLVPQLDLSEDVLRPRILNQEEPFACIECGAEFGVKSTIEKITEKLENNHAMFTNSDNVRLIQMCDNCRVKAQFHSDDSPFAGGDRPRVRTTDDYLNDREN